MKSTRDKILRTLLSFPGSTINDLAEAVGINGISIRHHLTSLEANDLVTSTEERHGVGRPRLTYTLTDKGVEEFPTSYLLLTKRVLNLLGDKMTSKEITDIFKTIGAEIASAYQEDLREKSMDERIRLLKSVMIKEGFVTEWKKNKDSYTLVSLSCPYYRVGIHHPEICSLDHAMISTFLDAPVEIKSCILNGGDRCTYNIPLEKEN